MTAPRRQNEAAKEGKWRISSRGAYSARSATCAWIRKGSPRNGSVRSHSSQHWASQLSFALPLLVPIVGLVQTR
jgi:hypothetical protein